MFHYFDMDYDNTDQYKLDLKNSKKRKLFHETFSFFEN